LWSLALVAAAGFASGFVASPEASAQCNILRPGIPDFDQVRAFRPAPFTFGLPNDGNMYCVPTSTVNLLAYLTNNGYPSIGGQPQNWQFANYNFVTQGLFNVGQLMNTSPTGGTGVPGWARGTRAILNFYYPGKFQVSWRMSNGVYAPTAREMYEVVRRGGLVTFAFGYYVEVRPGVFRRAGGHCMSLSGVTDACGPLPTIRFNDPANEQADKFTQSGFLTSTTRMTRVRGNFETGSLFQNRVQEELLDYRAPMIAGRQSRVFLDCYVATWPRFALARRADAGLGPGDRLAVITPISINGDTREVEVEIPVPGNQTIAALALQPDLTTGWVATGGPTPTLYPFDPQSGAFGPGSALTDPKALEFGRLGELYLLDGSLLKTLDVSSGAPVLVSERAPAGPIDAMAYRDTNDALFSLSLATGALTQYATPVLPGSPTVSFPLPSGVEILGEPSMAVGSDGSVFLTGDGGSSIFRLMFNAGTGQFDLAETIEQASIVSPRSLRVDADGRLAFTSDGIIRQLAFVGGAWVEASDAGLGGRRGIALALSTDRDNYDPAFSTEEEDINILPEAQPGGTPDCGADFNLDGQVDFFDYLAYVECYEHERCPRFRTPDFNADGFVDFFDYDAFVEVFETGC
jgi:hypothetical protein